MSQVLQQDLSRLMEEQQELSLKVVKNREIQEKIMEVEKQFLQVIEQQTPIVFYGGECHDVTICLVPSRIDSKRSEETECNYREISTVLTVNSSRLSRCSKYFETCMIERWTKQSSAFVLEMHTDIACYTDFFSRMFTSPFLKDFEDMEESETSQSSVADSVSRVNGLHFALHFVKALVGFGGVDD